MRDDVAGPLHDHGITDPDIVLLVANGLTGISETLDVILVVKRRVSHYHTADGDGRKPRNRRQCAGTPHLNLDLLDGGEGLFRREFMRRRPARAARAEAKALLQFKAVDLIDDAVDIVVEVGALQADLVVMGKDIGHRIQPLHQRIDRKAPVPEELYHVELRVGRHVGHFAPGVGKKFQLAACRHLRVELAQRSGCRIARVDVGLLSLGLHLLVERHKVALCHVDFTAHFHDGRHPLRQFVRNFLDGADIGRDVLARRAVAARCGRHQPAVLVTDRHGEPIDLRFGGKGDRLVRQPPEEAIDAGHKILHVLLGERIVKRQHRARMDDRRKGHRRCSADAARRAVFADQLRKPRLDRIVAPLQRIVIGVRNLRLILAMIERVVMGNLFRQPRELGGGIIDRQVFNCNGLGRHTGSLQRIWNCFRAKTMD